MKAFIVYNRFYNFEENTIYIGGVETYINNLLEVIQEYISDITIIQFSKEYIERKIKEGVVVIGIPLKKKNGLVRYAEKLKENKDDLLLFASTALLCRNNFSNTLAIQHGIFWDMNTIHGIKGIPDSVSIFLRFIESMLEIKKQKYCKKMVCVDYNYVNWYRTQSVERKLNYVVVPNFVREPDKNITLKEKGKSKLSIVYARRFEITRGINLICEVMPKILDKYANVEFTIAGSGSLELELKERFSKYTQVKFTKYSAENGVDFHKAFDIALVPSIGSEGTSLSLLEAMKAGCAVVGTDIGGITNIILDGFNGSLIAPTSNSLYNAVEKLIEDTAYRKKISYNAIETVNCGFNFGTWKEKWRVVLKELLYEKKL